MNAPWELVSHPLAYRTGWVLLHSVWQGCFVGIAFGALRYGLRRHSANLRYLAGCAALVLLFAGPVVTVISGWTPSFQIPHPSWAVVATAPVASSTLDAARVETSPVENSMFRLVRTIVDFLGRVAPGLAGLWLLGVIFFSCKLAQTWWWVRRLRTQDNEPVEEAWIEVLNDLRCRLEISRPVSLLKSALIEVPAVVGWLRPVILLPAATLAGLTPAQLEAILAHELAHVRRLDYLVNAAQCVLETVMFYHPVVWWVSRNVREERENCCDDLVVSVCSNRVTYARALARLEEFRADLLALAFAASGGSLLQRIRRLLGAPADDRPASARELGGLTLLGTGLLLIILGVYLMAAPNTYRAVARVKVEHDTSNVSDLMKNYQIGFLSDPYFIQTEFELIRSELILGKVIENLGLKAEWGKKFGSGEPLKMEEAIRLLRARLELKQVGNTSLLEICITTDTPQETARIANEVAEVFVAHCAGQYRAIAEDGLTSLQERSMEQEKMVEAAQAQVDQLRRTLNITDTSTSAEAPGTLLSSETLRRTEGLRIEGEAALSREEALLNQLKELQTKDFSVFVQALPTTVQDPLLNSLLEQQTAAERQLMTVQKDFGPNNMELIKAKISVQYLNDKITNRVNGIITGLEAKAASDRASLEQLKSSMAADTQKEIDEAGRNQPYWEAKWKLAELIDFGKTLQMKIAQEKIDYSLPKTSRVEIVDRAVPPLLPCAPNRYRAAAQIVLGLLLDFTGLWLLRRPRDSRTGQPLVVAAAS
jgi:beta-lactamase regulating signal transducer with metallopeptidase domain/uncharacterized protein involved in exopolysaccharide biosynthesis